MSADQLFQFAALQADRLAEDPRIQIAGFHLLFDMTGMSSVQVTRLNPAKNAMELITLFLTFLLNDKVDEICKKVPGLCDVLPADYGGHGSSVDQILANFSPEFKRYVECPHLWDEMAADESQRPDWTKVYVSDYGYNLSPGTDGLSRHGSVFSS
ncbi:unnamed protein product [Echinostoma caproni]|uniref:CRAL-TRIO domain-containing protein n=1 Tax=Echinostoma caproni TaxID=27848 RepID=A0A3P8KDI9_9TREM|nr:unnamed protein product [Echinostoma caproni]